MAILLPNAKYFVIVGSSLKKELDQHESFRKFFMDKPDSLVTLDKIEDFNIEHYTELSVTLFVVKHFDLDPNRPTNLGRGGDLPPIVTVNNTCNNNLEFSTPTKNPSSTPFKTPMMKTPARTPNSKNRADESELESVGYVTDYDDDELMQTALAEVSDFDNRAFSVLTSHKCAILGAVGLIQLIVKSQSSDNMIRMIPVERPLHNLAMQNALITFGGIGKTEAQQLLTLTRYMGAKSREDVTNKTTHLVAGNPRNTKYRKALDLGLPIMNTHWVREAYRMAHLDIEFEATAPEMVQIYKLKPFQGLQIAFVGFSEEDQKELVELTNRNEGSIVEPTSPFCSHIVVDAIRGDDDSIQSLNSVNPTINAHVVYREWFWASLEMEGKASEEVYAVPGFKPQTRRTSRSRRASNSSMIGYSSFSAVMSPALDYSRSPESISFQNDRQVPRCQSIAKIEEETPVLRELSARQRASLELLQTERNYVRILETIVKLFKVPLENPDIVEPILPATDVKIIFGNLTPIYEVHKRMLSDLENLIERDWKETNCIGRVFVSHSVELLKAYPPFVNFFEDTKKTIVKCDEKYPRFHAFLRRCQSNIECQRESLTEMLIRPVQRLPSISLIITELIKRTDDSNPDKKFLCEALESVRRVMNLINEDKRKTEGQIAMFDIVNSIEDCPPNLLSALRKFVCKAEARLLFMNNDSEILPSKSHKVVMFLFSDLVEICKIRSLKRSHSSKSQKGHVQIRRIAAPQAARFVSTGNNKKDYRHLDELRLCDVMNLYKQCQSSVMNEAFVLQARPSQRYEKNFRYYPFQIDDDSITKDQFIEKLEQCLCTCEDPDRVSEYVPQDLPPISNDSIDFGYANQMVNSMEKSRLSRVLSIRQHFSPAIKAQRNFHLS